MSMDDVTSKRVALLTGGWSDEREVALKSAHACEGALREAGFEHVDLIDVADEGLLSRLSAGAYDVAFIAMHGRWGEDGCVQGLCELLHIPYTFSHVLASAMATEKDVAKTVCSAAGIPVPLGEVIEAGTVLDDALVDGLVARLGLPMFVKPACNGSSFGVTKVNDRAELLGAISLALEGDGTALVESCVEGTEITVPVLGNENPDPLPIIEIDTGADFYDSKVKYEPSELHHVIPARIPEEAAELARKYAVLAHQTLRCSGASRSDFIVRTDGVPVLLETNTIPGMTAASLMPDSARHAGIEFPQLCRRFVELALEAN